MFFPSARRKAALHAQEDLLEHVVDVCRGDALRDEWTKARLEITLGEMCIDQANLICSTKAHSSLLLPA